MGYIDGENLIASTIKGHAKFDNDNVAQGKWTFLNKGKSDRQVILKPGGTEIERISKNVYVARHITVAEVWKSFKIAGASATALYGYVNNVVTQIEDNQKLGDTGGIIQNASASVVSEAEEMWVRGGGPAWLRQNVNILWHEQVTAS